MKASNKMDIENLSSTYSAIKINETVINLDPYANNNGENNWIIIIFMIFINICSLVSICLMIGIILFERFGPNSDDHILIDMVRCSFSHCKRALWIQLNLRLLLKIWGTLFGEWKFDKIWWNFQFFFFVSDRFFEVSITYKSI